jgi:hypothetical protein
MGYVNRVVLARMVAVVRQSPSQRRVPSGVNMATYTGYTCAGIHGAVVATWSHTPCILVNW